jgi:hypothetical protein
VGLDQSEDGVDSDCDGVVDDDVRYDNDGDGFLDDVDCDDSNGLVYPGAVEIARNGTDEDCNGSDLTDPITPVQGVLGTDTVLSQAGGPYVLTEDLSVPPGVLLVLEAGAELRFDGLHKLLVKGRLEGHGTPGQPVLLTSHSALVPGAWSGVAVRGGEASADLTYTSVQGASTAVDVEDGSVWLEQSTISDSLTGVDAYQPGTLSVVSTILTDLDVGASVAWGTLALHDSIVQECTTGVLGGSASTLDVRGTLVANNVVGLRPDGGVITTSRITGNDIGIDTGTGWVTMTANEIVDNIDGVVLGGYPVRKSLTWSTLTGNSGYAVVYVGGYDDGEIDATNNWWGTTDEAMVAQAIWDFYDDPALYPVAYSPILTAPDPMAGLP